MISSTSANFALIPQGSRDDWVSPEEVLNQLAYSMARNLLNNKRGELSGAGIELVESPDHLLEQTIIGNTARSILKHSNVYEPPSEEEKIPMSLKDRAIELFLDPGPLPENLVVWYKSLKKLDKLPEKIPPLPPNSFQAFGAPCPDEICNKLKLDGTPYKIQDTCTLLLIPEEFGNPANFEQIVRTYGEAHYPRGNNPLRYKKFLESDRPEHGGISLQPTHWLLHTNTVLENSRQKTWKEQVQLVHDLAKKTSTQWKVPESFHQTFLAISLTKIGTGKNLYEIGHDENEGVSTYTRARQSNDEGQRLVIGGFNFFRGSHDSTGVCVDCYSDTVATQKVGIAVCQTLE